jgi:branched-chain amino acid transport system ATP-binding protein
MGILLEIKDVHSGYGAIEVLKGINITIEEGETVSVIGANGAGKTTLLRTISGIIKVSKGEIFFNGKSIHNLSPEQIVKYGIINVPEGRRVFPRLTVMENLEMGAFLRKKDDSFYKDLDYIFSLFPILKERSKQLAGTLSGGEQQMLAIGRALMAKPQILLMDEPSLGLAPIMVSRIFEVISELNKQKVTILLVEQNAKMALKNSKRSYVLEIGSITLSGNSCELLEDERVKKAYLGM